MCVCVYFLCCYYYLFCLYARFRFLILACVSVTAVICMSTWSAPLLFVYRSSCLCMCVCVIKLRVWVLSLPSAHLESAP